MPSRPRSRPPSRPVGEDLYEQPGHLIRRAHQIAQGMFDVHVGQDVTPIQYAILRMVHEVPDIDQVGLARRIGLDTSTTATASARLESKGLLTRSIVPTNRRQLELRLTPEGEQLLQSLVDGVHEMRAQLLSGLEPKEQEQFMQLLRKFVDLNNGQSRAPLTVPEARTGVAGRPDVPATARKT